MSERRAAWIQYFAAPWLTRLLAACLLVAALNHVYAIIVPRPNDGSTARHALFVAANGALALGFILRWKWLWIPVSLLFLQQAYSHGADFLAGARQAELRWESALVLLALPVLILCAVSFGRNRETG